MEVRLARPPRRVAAARVCQGRGVIVWVNGAPEADLASVAAQMRRVEPGLVVLDPAHLGALVREALGDGAEGAEQEEERQEVWRSLTVHVALQLRQLTGRDVVVPCAVADGALLAAALHEMREAGEKVRHYFVDAAGAAARAALPAGTVILDAESTSEEDLARVVLEDRLTRAPRFPAVLRPPR